MGESLLFLYLDQNILNNNPVWLYLKSNVRKNVQSQEVLEPTNSSQLRVLAVALVENFI